VGRVTRHLTFEVGLTTVVIRLAKGCAQGKARLRRQRYEGEQATLGLVPRRRSLSSILFRTARRVDDIEALASRSPKRVARRAKNRLLGRLLGRAGLWRNLWR
jgi:hypothetical protein